jgi:hypothetical protein
MIHYSDTTTSFAPDRLPIGVNFSVRDEGLVSCRMLESYSTDLQTIVLRLSGPSGARVEHLESIADWSRLRWGGLPPGWYTVEADGLDTQGQRKWHAPQVRFRTSDDGVAQVCLNFCRFNGDRS